MSDSAAPRQSTVEWRAVGIDVERGKEVRCPAGWETDRERAERAAANLAGADPAYGRIVIERREYTESFTDEPVSLDA
jgi:hypothetical protein